MKDYAVSVIVPVYNAEKYIERCARSLFEQTLPDIEYIFIDDCSPDHSVEELDRVKNEYPKRIDDIKIIRLAQNEGSAKARLQGMKAARGKYIIQCDSDDWIDKDLYSKMFNQAEGTQSDVVICDICETDTHWKKIYIQNKSTDKTTWINDMLYHRASWSLVNKMFRNTIYQKIQYLPKCSMGEDSAIVLQMAYYCHLISYVSGSYYYYYSNPNSIVNTKSTQYIYRKFTEALDNTNIIVKFYQGRKEYDTFKGGIRYLCYFTKSLLLPITNKSHYKDIWKKCFPGIEKLILQDSKNLFKDRFKCLLILLNIYPNITNKIGLTKCK